MGRAARETVSCDGGLRCDEGSRPPSPGPCVECRGDAHAWALREPPTVPRYFARTGPVCVTTTTPLSSRITSHCCSTVYRFITVQ